VGHYCTPFCSDDRDEAFFGNIDMVIKSFIVGFEYTQDTDVGEDPAGEPLSTDDIWEAHVAWMHKDLTLVVAYINSGEEDLYDRPAGQAHPISLGDGWVVSAQYAF
jgi:hypothetical protein